MTNYSPFTITAKEASQLVQASGCDADDNRHCYMLQVSFEVVYGGGPLPQSAYKKLPRLVNGIPLGPGRLSQSQAQRVQWLFVERCSPFFTFVSRPISQEEAEENKGAFRERMVKHAKQVFGDITVKTTILLSQCVSFDTDIFVNDIAACLEEGLHFQD